ncbi:hypothetical protein [Cryobacterium cheniae]|nr:hypothetical protein [Cryobacterium cheniae]
MRQWADGPTVLRLTGQVEEFGCAAALASGVSNSDGADRMPPT